MSDHSDEQIPPVVAGLPARPGAADYRVPHANVDWETPGEPTSSGRVAIVGCLGLALLVLGLLCILVGALSNL